MTPEEIINEISEWANASHAYLSNREGYPRGYRNGISQAKVIILDILSKAHRTSEEDKLFPIIGITKQELEDNGFDTSKLDESDMLTMADKIKDALNDNGYQDILNIVAEECMNILLCAGIKMLATIIPFISTNVIHADRRGIAICTYL